MLTLRKVAVTGSIASGKTTVCRILESYGAYVISADKVVHRLLSLNSSLTDQVIDLLGVSVISNKQLDRKKIAEIVFTHPEKLKALEKILHPAVFDEITKQYETIKPLGTYSLFVVEIPLLFETESEAFYDATIAVIAEDTTCKARFLHHTGLSMKQYELRATRQMPPAEKSAKAHYTILNNGTLSELEEAVVQLLPTLLSH